MSFELKGCKPKRGMRELWQPKALKLNLIPGCVSFHRPLGGARGEAMTKKKWDYDPGVRRFKHKWSRPEAGFDERRGVPIGKCPNSITVKQAERLLNSGVPWPEEWESSSQHPSRIYNVFEGVVYEAVPTMRGYSYHGFPARKRLPRLVLCELEKRATEAGFAQEFKQWIKTYCQE